MTLCTRLYPFHLQLNIEPFWVMLCKPPACSVLNDWGSRLQHPHTSLQLAMSNNECRDALWQMCNVICRSHYGGPPLLEMAWLVSKPGRVQIIQQFLICHWQFHEIGADAGALASH